jgi:hypothetical protein
MWQSPEVIKIHTGNMTSKCPNYSCASPNSPLASAGKGWQLFGVWAWNPMMPGVRRSGVTVTAGTMKQADLISYTNGHSVVKCWPLNGRSCPAIPSMLLTSPIRPFHPINQPLQTLQQNLILCIRAIYGRPPPCKSFLERCDIKSRLLPSIRPVYAVRRTAGPDEIRGSTPNHAVELFRSLLHAGSADPGPTYGVITSSSALANRR